MSFIIKRVDQLLNSITMYRLLLYGLILLLVLASFFGFMGVLSLSGLGIVLVAVVLVAVSYLTNKLLEKLYGAVTNSESYLITALILACILPPSTTVARLSYVALAGAVAVVSKFLISYHHKHIFNPAVAGALFLSLTGLMSVTWWIGNPTMLPFVVIFGLLILRKIRGFKLALTFVAASIAMLVLVGVVGSLPLVTLLKNAVLSGPLIFLASVMLTEPATMPVHEYYQLLYGLLVGALFSAQLRFGILSTSPHMVLAVGNIFAFILNPKFKLNLTLKAKNEISPRVYDYVFKPDHRFSFEPGQYMEWTMPNMKSDGRGNRRSFTIASSPTEPDVHMGVKFYAPPSNFKRALFNMKPGDKIAAGQLAGNFTLPTDSSKKLVFIAGGVGVTPFRSMAKYLTDTREQRDIVLFYLVSDAAELAYTDIFTSTPGLKFVPITSGRLSLKQLAGHVPDFSERLFYISGPNGLVESYRELLRHHGVHASQIISDYFSGY
ncbi:MAG: oxidoreductase [Candidatus Saccharibacteria bacterium]|nr:oxidoreductase [Candidatus Saccharibacteria bacterium]